MPSELAAIVREGERFHVRVVPIVETLSHQDQLLDDPAYQRLAEQAPEPTGPLRLAVAMAGRFAGHGPQPEVDEGRPASRAAGTFCATDPKALRLALGMVGDVAAITTDSWFHAGGDECEPIAEGRSARTVRDRGFGMVYGAWFNAVSSRLARLHGRRTMLYADMALAHATVLEQLPRDVVLVDWHYDPADTFATLARLRRAGFNTVLSSSALWNWRTFYPHYIRALPNIAHASDAARRERAAGTIVASWCDGGTETLREFNWPGYAYAAAAAWEAHSPPPEAVLAREAPLRYGAAAAELAKVEQALADLPPPRQGWWGRAFHAPPGVRPRTAPWLAQVRLIERRMQAAGTVLDRVGGHADPDRVALLRHAVGRFRYLADREITLDRVARRVALAPRRSDPASAAELRSLADRLHEMSLDYARLWCRYNRPDGLAPLTRRLGDQESALRTLAASAAAGTLTTAASAVRIGH
jgi:hypothetical protein